jgi:hypothetical protein
MYLIRYNQLIRILLEASDGFLNCLQQEIPFIKISIPYSIYTMRKPPESDRLSPKGRVRVKGWRKGGSQGTHQPMFKLHEHLIFHWLIKFLPLSNFIKALILFNPRKLQSNYPVINL